jgi:hypothetical protein
LYLFLSFLSVLSFPSLSLSYRDHLTLFFPRVTPQQRTLPFPLKLFSSFSHSMDQSLSPPFISLLPFRLQRAPSFLSLTKLILGASFFSSICKNKGSPPLRRPHLRTTPDPNVGTPSKPHNGGDAPHNHHHVVLAHGSLLRPNRALAGIGNALSCHALASSILIKFDLIPALSIWYYLSSFPWPCGPCAWLSPCLCSSLADCACLVC